MFHSTYRIDGKQNMVVTIVHMPIGWCAKMGVTVLRVRASTIVICKGSFFYIAQYPVRWTAQSPLLFFMSYHLEESTFVDDGMKGSGYF